MKFIKKIFLMLIFLSMGLSYNLSSIARGGGARDVSAENLRYWWPIIVGKSSDLNNFFWNQSKAYIEKLNAGIFSKINTFFDVNPSFKFELSGQKELERLNNLRKTIIEKTNNLSNYAKKFHNIRPQDDLNSITLAKTCLKQYANNIQNMTSFVKQNSQTTVEPGRWWWLSRSKTQYPLHDSINERGITDEMTRRYALDYSNIEQKEINDLKQCLDSVENQELIDPLKKEVLSDADHIEQRARQLRLDSIKYNFKEFVKRAWEIPAVKTFLISSGIVLAPVILYKLYRAFCIYPYRLIKEESCNSLSKKEVQLIGEIDELNQVINDYNVQRNNLVNTTAQNQQQNRLQSTSNTTQQQCLQQDERVMQLCEKNRQLKDLLQIKRDYEQYSGSAVAWNFYMWPLKALYKKIWSR
ncbi:hypothetical protein GF322_04385 [Candidatus Dependentiae bacterium]|nr:hypothetical protein [Candidatus Dependentiae bacterium]